MAAQGTLSGTPASADLRPQLSLFDAVAIVVGTVIGSGIFLLPSDIAAQLHSLGPVLLVWALGGVLTVCGAWSLAELGAAFPGTGGLCTYLHRAYGPVVAFLYAWGLLAMIQTGSIAALAVAFGLYLRQVVPMPAVAVKIFAVAVILALTAINCLGLRGGKLVQNLIACAKVAGLAGLILLLLLKGAHPLSWVPVLPAPGGVAGWAGFGIALVAVLWAYEGWHLVTFVGGEMKRPKRDLPRSLFYGTALVTLIYLVANLGYYHMLTPEEIRGSHAVAAFAAGRALGPAAAITLSLLILISILGSLNGLILTGPRVSYAMAREDAFPGAFGSVHARYRTPLVAILAQGLWAALLAASGSYTQLYTDVIFTAWIFYGLAVAAVPLLRHRQPQLPRPFRVPGYPWVCLLFCAAALGLVASTVVKAPGNAAVGLSLLAVGIPIYYFFVRPSRRRHPAAGVRS